MKKNEQGRTLANQTHTQYDLLYIKTLFNKVSQSFFAIMIDFIW